MRHTCILGLLFGLAWTSVVAAQEIVSAQSGVVHYLEGAVSIDGSPVDHKPAAFPLLKNGSVLRTEKGRVELMLTPGAFLRLDENSSVKMLSSALTATSLEFIKGSVILDALAEGDIPITLQFKDASVHFSKRGLYRIDSETEVLQAYSGEAVVDQEGKQTRVDTSRLYFFQLGTDTKKFSDGADDEFLDWARNRNQVITEENQAAQADADDAAADPDLLSNSPFFNYGVPPPIVPNYGYGSIYPYGYPGGGFFYNSYAPTTAFPLPPLPFPGLLVLGRRGWNYHNGTLSQWPSSHWPSSGVWRTGVNSPLYPTRSIGSWPRPVTTTAPRPAYVRPAVTPRISRPAVHAVGHR